MLKRGCSSTNVNGILPKIQEYFLFFGAEAAKYRVAAA